MSVRMRMGAVFTLYGLVLGVTPASADVVHLKSGGVIRGDVDPASLSDDAAQIVIETLEGARIVVSRDEVTDITQRSLIVERYVTRARRVPHTVEARWELAEWCKRNGLTPQRREQLELLLDLEPDHADARRILGHVRHNGRWMTREEWMTERGYVRHENRWVTQQELELILKSDAERAAETEWYPKVRLWLTWASGRSEQRRLEGITNLEAIADPDAVPALMNFLGEHENAAVRLTCMRILGRLPGGKPVQPLVERSLHDSDDDVRAAAREGLSAEQYETALNYYVPALQNDSNTIVRRAAVALGEIGEIDTVPYLISALVTEHQWKVEVPSNTAVTFGSTPSGQLGLQSLNSLSGHLPAEVELLTRTGQLPYGAIVIPPPYQRRTRIVTIKGDVRNAEVLAALEAITGEDFGYSKERWRRWWAARVSG